VPMPRIPDEADVRLGEQASQRLALPVGPLPAPRAQMLQQHRRKLQRGAGWRQAPNRTKSMEAA